MKRLLFIPLVLFVLSYTLANNRDECDVSVSYQSGWNLISLPVEVDDANYLSLFPNSIEGTLYSFTDSAYNEESEMIPGQGCWFYFSTSDTEIIVGECLDDLTVILQESWNLTSVGSTSLNINDIIDPNGSIVENAIFGFDGSYYEPELLEPGDAYWIMSDSESDITLPSQNNPTKAYIALQGQDKVAVVNVNTGTQINHHS